MVPTPGGSNEFVTPIASQVAFGQKPFSANAGQAFGPVVVNVEDVYGNLVNTDSSNVTLSTSAAMGGTTSVSAVNGVARFTGLSINRAGTHTLTATDGVLSPATSSAFPVAPGAAAQLLFSQQPSSAMAGHSIGTIVVHVEDIYGNLVTDDASTLAVYSSTGITGTRFAVASGGIAVFNNLSIILPGSYILTATYGGLFSAASNSITITPAAASRLVFVQQPTTTIAGQDISTFTVSIEDAYGNLITDSSALVSLTDPDLGGSSGLTGQTAENAVKGVATFTGVSIEVAGANHLTAVCDSLNLNGLFSSGYSNAFDVTPAVSAQLVITQQPMDATILQNIGTVMVRIEDAYGNLVTGDTSTVTISASSAINGNTSVSAAGGIATFNGLSITQAGTYALTVGDGNLVAATTNSITISAITASKLAFVQQPNGAAAGQTIGTVIVDIEDAYGNLISNDASVVTLSGSSLNGHTSVTAIDGVATFTGLSMTLAGTRTLTAGDGSLTTATSNPIAITATAANRLVVVQAPNSATAGQLIGTVTVDVEDFYGNLASTDHSTVTLSSDAAIGGNASVSAVGGIAAFTNLSIDLAGTHSLTVTDGSLSSSTGNSMSILPAAPARLVISRQPTGAAAAQSIGTVEAEVEDAFGNLVTTDNSTVELSIVDGTPLHGTASAVVVNGAADFTGLSINLAGNYTLSATDGALAPAATNQVSITPGAAAQLVLVQQPTDTAAGRNISTIEVDVEDAEGNLVATDDSLITASSDAAVGGANSVSAVAGVASFSDLSMTPAGAHALSFTGGGLSSTSSNLFNIAPAAAAKLVFATQPTQATEGQTVSSFAVEIEDAFGNIVTTDGSTVAITTNDGTPLDGTTSVTAIGGVATFSDLAISQPGSHSLAAADGDLSPAMTNPIAVIPALAAINITAQAASVSQGGTLQFTATGTDGTGAPIALGTVTWSLDPGSVGSINQLGQLTAGKTVGIAIVRATSEGRTATLSIAVKGPPPVITVSAYANLLSSTSDTATLHVRAEQDGSGANLTYTWSIINQPTVGSDRRQVGAEQASSAALALFSVNGTNAAKNTTVTFLASGDFTPQVQVSDGTQSVTSQVQVTAKAKQALAQTTQVSGVQTIGDAQSITGFVVTFSGALDPTTAQNIRGYRILQKYTVGVEQTFWQRLFRNGSRTQTEYAAYPIASAVYDPQTDSVTLTLAAPMPMRKGQRLVQVLGTGPYAVRGVDGQIIDGDANGKAGGTFRYHFSMQASKSVSFRTANGDIARLSLSGPGRIAVIIPAGTSGPAIYLRDTDASSSILTGKLRTGRRSLGYAVLDQLNDDSHAIIQLGGEFHINSYIQ